MNPYEPIHCSGGGHRKLHRHRSAELPTGSGAPSSGRSRTWKRIGFAERSIEPQGGFRRVQRLSFDPSQQTSQQVQRLSFLPKEGFSGFPLGETLHSTVSGFGRSPRPPIGPIRSVRPEELLETELLETWDAQGLPLEDFSVA